ncbi:MAG: hypothetical protein JAY90_17460 [Candidatus Thiodiazotropha lotti]|nr:hypothetical protein [Candidatus Thiodiazotropha lotti]ODC02033.1 hypothetical protein A3197_21545 [Candidatus Thiodiazotropha endoloripes]
MESSEDEIIRSLKNKYQVSDYQLMNYLGIKYKNGSYYVGDSAFDSYYYALKAADIEFSKSSENKQKEEPKNNNSGSFLSILFKGVLFLFFSVSLFFLILPLTAHVMVLIFGKMGGSVVGYIASLISILFAFVISSIIVAKM